MLDSTEGQYAGEVGRYLGRELLADARQPVVPVQHRVSALLEAMREVVGKTHEPRYLLLRWGTGLLAGFRCRLVKADVTYSVFDRGGTPLRATMALQLREYDAGTRPRSTNLQSPDITHSRTVRAGDTLLLLCQEVYGTVRHAVDVATVNGLDDLRRLEPGRVLLFPPYERA